MLGDIDVSPWHLFARFFPQAFCGATAILITLHFMPTFTFYGGINHVSGIFAICCLIGIAVLAFLMTGWMYASRRTLGVSLNRSRLLSFLFFIPSAYFISFSAYFLPNHTPTASAFYALTFVICLAASLNGLAVWAAFAFSNVPLQK